MIRKCDYAAGSMVCARDAGHDGEHRTARFIKLLQKFADETPAGEHCDARDARADRFNEEHKLP